MNGAEDPGAGAIEPPSPIIVTAILGDRDFAELDRQRRRYFPPERNQLSAHLAMFHHLAPSLLAELQHRLSCETMAIAPPDARLSSLISLGRGVAYRVHSPALEAIRARLADAFSGMLTPQDAAPWRAHVTIQNKVSPAEAKALMATLERDFQPRPLAIAGLAAWWYRGGPWELISRHRFR